MKQYETKDFYLAGLLMSHGMKLVGSDKREKGVFFHILCKDEDKLNKLLQDFLDYDAMVNLNKLIRSISILRKELDKHKNK